MMDHQTLRVIVASSLPNQMFCRKQGWDETAASTPEEWVDKYARDKQFVDHYFVELMAEYLKRKIVIYPVFKEEVKKFYVSKIVNFV